MDHIRQSMMNIISMMIITMVTLVMMILIIMVVLIMMSFVPLRDERTLLLRHVPLSLYQSVKTVESEGNVGPRQPGCDLLVIVQNLFVDQDSLTVSNG